MPSYFVELKFDDGIRNFTEANFPNYRASHQGCWDYNRDNPDNPNMVCVAEYENGAWSEIGYIVVNRGGAGRALPWGKSASEAFRDFAQSEEICKNKIRKFLNARYPGGPSGKAR